MKLVQVEVFPLTKRWWRDIWAKKLPELTLETSSNCPTREPPPWQFGDFVKYNFIDNSAGDKDVAALWVYKDLSKSRKYKY